MSNQVGETMPRMNIELSEDDLEYINNEVSTGNIGSTSELIAQALKEYRRGQGLDELDRLVEESLASGESIEVTPEYWEEKRKKILERRRAVTE